MSDEDEKAGERIFEALSVEDKRQLKRYITRQIQNVLANEYGIGGARTLPNKLDESVKRQLDAKSFVERVGQWLIDRRGIDPKAVIEGALKAAAKKAVEDRVGEAARNINVTFHIGTAPPADAPDGWGKF